jgi:hypothetical protein
MTATTPAVPATAGNTEIGRFNALKHGVLSRYTVLHGRTPTNTAPSSPRWRPNTRRRDRPKSIWSRSWLAFCGANAAFA